jgi:hypothetical protein
MEASAMTFFDFDAVVRVFDDQGEIAAAVFMLDDTAAAAQLDDMDRAPGRVALDYGQYHAPRFVFLDAPRTTFGAALAALGDFRRDCRGPNVPRGETQPAADAAVVTARLMSSRYRSVTRD